MITYLKNHEEKIKDALRKDAAKKEWEMLLVTHEIAVEHFQHERLIHLLVTLAFGICLLISVYMTLTIPHTILFLIDILLCMLLVPYIFHYRDLENGVQRLYKLGDELQKKKDAAK